MWGRKAAPLHPRKKKKKAQLSLSITVLLLECVVRLDIKCFPNESSLGSYAVLTHSQVPALTLHAQRRVADGSPE